MTNGEKLKEIFPNNTYVTLKRTTQFAINPMTLHQQMIVFDNDFWNAEYQEPTTKNDLGVDCISRQAVLEQAYAYGNGLEPDGYCVNVEDIQAMPSVTPQESRWIPVSERLPEAEYGESDSVLVCFENETQDVLYFDGSNWRYPTGETYLSVNHKNDWHNKVVTWMPLPKSYSEVEE